MQTVELPLDGARFERLLRQHIRKSHVKKRIVTSATAEDFATSFNR
jgi:hypothetical protein